MPNQKDEAIRVLSERLRDNGDYAREHISRSAVGPERDSYLLQGFIAAIQTKLQLDGIIDNEQESEWSVQDENWNETYWRADLNNAIREGDPLDIAIHAMFGWYHRWTTTAEETRIPERSGFEPDFTETEAVSQSDLISALRHFVKLHDTALLANNERMDAATSELLRSLTTYIVEIVEQWHGQTGSD